MLKTNFAKTNDKSLMGKVTVEYANGVTYLLMYNTQEGAIETTDDVLIGDIYLGKTVFSTMKTNIGDIVDVEVSEGVTRKMTVKTLDLAWASFNEIDKKMRVSKIIRNRKYGFIPYTEEDALAVFKMIVEEFNLLKWNNVFSVIGNIKSIITIYKAQLGL